MDRLIDDYPNAYADFYGCNTPCVYKTGPAWYQRAQGIVREARPIYRHPIACIWLSVLTRITDALDSLKVQWTCINPLSYANAGEANLFCPFVISIGVKPESLIYSDAVAAAKAVQSILDDIGHPTIQVAFVESVVHRSGAGPELLSWGTLLDLPELRKPFTSCLGLAIAPHKHPHYEGTGALYYRLSKDDDRVALLTCAHVARPPPAYKNTGMTMEEGKSQAREGIIALGTGAYSNAIKAIMRVVEDQIDSIEIRNYALERLGAPVEGERDIITEKRESVERAKKTIERANALHDKVTKDRALPDQRVIGFVLHSEKIEVSTPPHNFTKDWALVELYRDMIDWDDFKGNKVFIGTSFPSSSLSQFQLTMITLPHRR